MREPRGIAGHPNVRLLNATLISSLWLHPSIQAVTCSPQGEGSCSLLGRKTLSGPIRGQPCLKRRPTSLRTEGSQLARVCSWCVEIPSSVVPPLCHPEVYTIGLQVKAHTGWLVCVHPGCRRMAVGSLMQLRQPLATRTSGCDPCVLLSPSVDP